MDKPLTARAAGLDKFKYHKLFVADERLSHAEVRVMDVLWDYSDKDCDSSRPGRTTIRDRAHVSRRKCDETLKKLVDEGYLLIREEGGRGAGGKPLATVYALSVPSHWSDPSFPLRGNEPVDKPMTSFPLRGNEPTSTFPLRDKQVPPEGSPHSPSGVRALPPEGEPFRSFSNPPHTHSSDAVGAPPPPLEGASNSPLTDADGNAQDWGLSGSASYDWGTQGDTQPNASALGWEPAKDTAPESADPPAPSVPSHDASGSDQIGTGRRALQELLAQRRPYKTQEATP